MEKKMNFSILLIILALSSIIYSQGIYVDSSHNHLGIKGVFSYHEISSNKTLSELGFSKRFIIEDSFTRGLLSNNSTLIEIGIEFSEIFFINKIDNSFDEDKEKYSIDLVYHIKNPSYFYIALISNFSSFSIPSILYNFGVEIYKTLINHSQFRIIPFLGLKQISPTIELNDNVGNIVKDDSKKSIITYGFGYISNNVFVEPRFNIFQDGSEFSLGIGIIIPNQ